MESRLDIPSGVLLDDKTQLPLSLATRTFRILLDQKGKVLDREGNIMPISFRKSLSHSNP